MVFGFGECSTVTYSNGTFYVGVDGEGVYALTADEWALVAPSDKAFTKAIDANGVPLFATKDGYILDAVSGTLKLVKAGELDIAFNGKLFAIVSNGDNLETFMGNNMLSLVSSGTGSLDGFVLHDFYADAKGVIVGVGKMNDAQPVNIIFRNGKWLFVFGDTEAPITNVVNNAVTIGSKIYTTTDYIDFVAYHDVAQPVTKLLYA